MHVLVLKTWLTVLIVKILDLSLSFTQPLTDTTSIYQSEPFLFTWPVSVLLFIF